MKVKLQARNFNRKSLVFLMVLAILPNSGFSAKYGDKCDTDLDQCISNDFRDPLECIGPENPPTTEPSTSTTIREDPTTSENPTTTENPTTSDVPTTTEEPTTSEEPSTTENPTTSEEPSTTEEPTTSEEPTTTEEPTTSEEPTTTEEPTTSEEPSTTENPTTSVDPTTTEDNTTTENSTSMTKDNLGNHRSENLFSGSTLTTTHSQFNHTPLEQLHIPEAYDANDDWGNCYNWNEWDEQQELQSILPVTHPYKESTILEAGFCGCKRGTIRHVGMGRCVSPPNQECDLKSADGGSVRTCTKYAQCYPSASVLGYCHCDHDAKPDLDWGVCKLIYGSNRCNHDTDCDEGLKCHERTCLCEFQETQRWSEKHGVCVNVHGASCRESEYWPKPLCVENAICENNITCKCDASSGFIPTSEKKCKLDFSQSCEVDEDCHPNFVCSITTDNSTCACPNNQIYFTSTHLCHLPAGSHCGSNSTSDQCTLQSSCLDESCSCNGGYEHNLNSGLCQALHGSLCSIETPCQANKFLGECSVSYDGTGVCECLPNYNFQNGRCIGNIDEQCNNDEDCVGNSYCNGEFCTCTENRIPGSKKQTCYSGYGNTCDMVDCHPDLNLKCNETTSNGEIGDYTCICKVPTDQVYNEVVGDCLTLADKPCEASESIKTQCVDNAECIIQNDQSAKCQCTDGFRADSNGLCEFGKNDSVSSRSVELKVFLYGLILPHLLEYIFNTT